MKPNPGPTTATSSRTKASSARCMVKLDVTTAGQACDKKRAISNQNFEEIRRRILSKRYQGILNGEDAFVDKLFPPDKGSLTYVYSGDDKYDRMSFRRPMELSPCPRLYVPHGLHPITNTIRRFSGRQWLLHAFATVSLNPIFMNRLIPARQQKDQNFTNNYTGAFLFVLWRFGEWVEVVIDDYLPILDGHPAFCPAFGDPPVYWPALLEKAYAKCNKAYEAIEAGNPLSALTDFTGAVCEHYKPNECITNDLFHVIYKSSVNRSLIVGWRNAQSFRESTIRPGEESSEEQNHLTGPSWDEDANGWPSAKGPHMFIITGATKFPLRDGRMLEMIRLKCPHDPGATWWGDFSVKNPHSWHSLHPTFAENFTPQDCLDGNEFWIPYIEFCRHFADLIICSSVEPCLGIQSNHCRSSFSRSDDGVDLDSESSVSYTGELNETDEFSKAHGHLGLPVRNNLYEKRGSIEITVQESVTTVKLDTVRRTSHRRRPNEATFFVKRRSTLERNGSALGNAMQNHVNKGQSGHLRYNNQNLPASEGKNSIVPSITMTSAGNANERTQNSLSRLSSPLSRAGSKSSVHEATSGTKSHLRRDPSIASNLSDVSVVSNNSLSDTESTNSASEVKIRLKSSQSRRNVDRPLSAPVKSPTHLPNAAKNFDASIFEARVDYFRPQGSWRKIAEYMGAWTKSTSGGPPCDKESHSRNPRVFFALSQPDTVNEVIATDLQGKCHVIISLLQDSCRGACTHSSMTVGIGFCLYRSKSPEKDDKRPLSKLQLLRNVISTSESREVVSRFDLDPGFYMLVPYTNTINQENHFLLRIMGEKDQVAGKTGCSVS